MLNVSKKFEQLEKMQLQIGNKLDFLETKFFNNDKTSKFNEILSVEDQYKLQCDLEELLKERNHNSKTRDIENNYLKFYDSLSELNKNKMMKNLEFQKLSARKSNSSNSKKDSQRKKFVEKGVGTDKQVLLTFNEENIQDNNNLTSIEKINKETMHKKQNVFLTNELVNLRGKINKIKTKNKIFQNILAKSESVKNCKLMEKLVISFIEKLAINWNEIVDKLIDDILEEEILVLNEIELERIKRNEKKVTEFEDLLKNCPSSSDENLKDIILDKNSLNEINRMISDFSNEENAIFKKYLKNV